MLVIKEDEFQSQVLDCKQPVLLDFFAQWCGPCKMLTPVLEKVSQNYADKMKFVKIDTDQCPAIATRYEIRGIPTLVIIKDGMAVDRHVGYMREPELDAFISKHVD